MGLSFSRNWHRMRGHRVPVGRTRVLPDLDHRHVIGPAGLRKPVEAQVALVAAAGFAQLFNRCGTFVLELAGDVDGASPRKWRL